MKYVITLILFSAIGFKAQAQTNIPILDRKITVKVERQTLAKTLNIISETANFNFSYSSSVLKANRIVSIMAENRTVREILDQLFNKELTYQQIGNHLVLQKRPVPKKSNNVQGNSDKQVKYSYVITGYIRDLNSGDGILNASVFEKQTLSSGVSGDFGYYRLSVISRSPEISLRFSKSGYRDTIVKIRFQSDGLNECHINLLSDKPLITEEEVNEDTVKRSVALTDSLNVDSSKQIAQTDSSDAKLVWSDSSDAKFKLEDTRAGKWLISAVQKLNEKNIRDSIHRDWQVTFLPPIGSNGELSGLVVNRLSWNIIAGYNGGLKGAEFGGLLNVLRKDMEGAQFSGFGNVVGGNVSGAQFAGFFNHNIGLVDAFQAAGFYNYNHADATGAQFAGFMNLSNGNVDGVQAAGFLNLAGRGSAIVQMAGFMNISDNITGVQGAGFMNIAGGNSQMVQAAGFMNIAEEMYGTQLAGFMNIADYNGGVQAAGFMNIADKIEGGQIAGFMNIARIVRGFQIGVFNIADTAEGFVLGIFNFIGNGLHQIEMSTNELGMYGLAYRSGLERLYSNVVFTTELPLRDSATLMSNGFGLGTRVRISDAFRVTCDLTAHQFNFNFVSNHLNLMSRLNVSLEWRIFKGFAVFGGASLAHMVNQKSDPRYESRFKEMGTDKVWELQNNAYAQKAWLGYQFGIRLL